MARVVFFFFSFIKAALTDPGPNGGSDRSLEQACAWQTDTVAMQVSVQTDI